MSQPKAAKRSHEAAEGWFPPPPGWWPEHPPNPKFYDLDYAYPLWDATAKILRVVHVITAGRDNYFELGYAMVGSEKPTYKRSVV